MKTLNLLAIIFLFVLSSCNSGVKTNGKKVTFGVYEVVNVNEIPKSIVESLKAKNILLENNPKLSVVGYIQKTDSSFLQLDLSRDNLKLVKTIYVVDKDNKYNAIVAVRPNPIIDNSDIENTKSNGNKVEIYFNMKGAEKWADLTKKNIGKTLAFIIDYKVYSMPVVNAEIRNGAALINGLANDTLSKNISESLNSGISE